MDTNFYNTYWQKVSIEIDEEKEDDFYCSGDELFGLSFLDDGFPAVRETVYNSTLQVLQYLKPYINSNLMLTIWLNNDERESQHLIFMCSGSASYILICLDFELELLQKLNQPTTEGKHSNRINNDSPKKRASRKNINAKQIGFVIPNNDKTIN